jgi:flavin-binding protein dodecin
VPWILMSISTGLSRTFLGDVEIDYATLFPERNSGMPDHIYKHIELTGSSKTSSDDAIRAALERASKTLHGMKWFEVVETRGHIEDAQVAHWQVTIRVGFTLDE